LTSLLLPPSRHRFCLVHSTMGLVAIAAAALFTTLSYAFAFLVTYWLFIWGYRLFLHPLGGCPGPFLARLSDFHVGYHVLNQRLHLQTFQDHEKYGKPLY
jgi:hypothetical protein